MSIIENLESAGKIESVEFDDMMKPEEIIDKDIIRIHLIFFIVGLVFTLFLVIL